METAGPNDEVLKLLAPLTISDEMLTEGLDRVEKAMKIVSAKSDMKSAKMKVSA